jgi:hypothetical protein
MRTPTVVSDEEHNAPVGMDVLQNFPNPFNPTTRIEYRMQETGAVRLTVCDVAGREVDVLVNDVQSPGQHAVIWNAAPQPSGTYIIVLSTTEGIRTRKVVLLK